MKIYVHHEIATPHFTLAVEWPVDSLGIAHDLGARFAQAFNAAHPGEKPLQATEVSLVDADGVALASVQAVYERVRQQDRQIGANLSTRPLSCRRDFGLTRGGVLCAATMSSALAAGAEREAAMQRRLERLERLVETALAAV